MTVYIGDVHGKFERYKKIIKRCTDSIQVGDMGVGFRKWKGGELVYDTNPPYDAMVDGNHRFIRGNHDNPYVCLKHGQWIPDGTYDGLRMFVGGALSIDKEWRTIGESYWEDEELSQVDLWNIY